MALLHKAAWEDPQAFVDAAGVVAFLFRDKTVNEEGDRMAFVVGLAQKLGLSVPGDYLNHLTLSDESY